jgi:hypothetical protein
MQKTGINIDDLTHSMASDVSTVANNWDGFWASTDTKDTKAAGRAEFHPVFARSFLGARIGR